MIAEFFNFEGCIAVRLYYCKRKRLQDGCYKDSNKALRSHLDVKDILDKYNNYNITGTSRYETFTSIFETGYVEVADVVEYYTDIQF